MKWFRNMIDRWKFGVGMATGQIVMPNSQILKTKIRDYNIFVSDMIVKGVTGCEDVPMACTVMINISLVPILPNLQPAYVVNEAFLKLNEKLQTAIMAHEEGHIALEHYVNRSKVRSLMDLTKRLIVELPTEYEADRYAFDLLGQEYIDMLVFLRGFKGIRHLDKRISKLRRISQ